MKKIAIILMVFVCALLFSCATDDGAAPDGNSAVPLLNAGSGDAADISTEQLFIARSLADDPVIGKWAAKYSFDQNPVLYGIPLIADNAAFADIPDDIRKRKEASEALCDENRFLDAWYAYGEDDSEYIVALKIMHLVDCWTDTIMHQGFVLSNLEPDQDLYEYRDSPTQKGKTIFYDPVEEAQKWADEHCGGVMPHILELALGCYYSDAAVTFGDDWQMPQEDTFELSVEYFKKAITAGVYNDYALACAADSALANGYFTDALAIIHCLELTEPDYFLHFYKEAYCYMCKGEYQNAMPCVARAILCSTIPEEVAANTVLFADCFMYDSTDISSALSVLEACKPFMEDYYFADPLFMNLDILMFAKGYESDTAYDSKIISVMTEAFAWNYLDEDFLYRLTDYYYNYNCFNLGIQWIEGILKEYDGEWITSANLNFELGQFYLQVQNYENALVCFDKAEEYFTKAGQFDESKSTIPYYQKLCREQLLSNPKKNKI